MEEAASGLWGLNQASWWWLFRCGYVVCLVVEASLNLLPLALVVADISSISNLCPELGRRLCQQCLCLPCQTVLVLQSQSTMEDVYVNAGSRMIALFEVLLRYHCEHSQPHPFVENKLIETLLWWILKTVEGF